MELAQLQLLQRYVGNRTLARVFDKGFWIVEDDGAYTWHKGTDTAGFVPSGLPNYKSKGSWFAWPVYRRSPTAPTVADASATPVAESAGESPGQSEPPVVEEPETSGGASVPQEEEPEAVSEGPVTAEASGEAAVAEEDEPQPVPEGAVTANTSGEDAVTEQEVPEAVPQTTLTAEPQSVPQATVTAEPQAVPQATVTARPQAVAQPAPAPAIDYANIGERIVDLAIRKFQQDYRFSGPEVRVSDCTGIRLSSLDAERVFAATRDALRNLNPGTEISGRRTKQKFTAAGGGPNGRLGGHKGRDFNIKVKKVDKDGRVVNDAPAEAQIHVRWL